MINTANIGSLWASLAIEEFIRTGVSFFCLSPGSRCTPLTVAVASHEKAEKLTHYDERGAAFFALGRTRATNRPTALICTSGTAAANYFPAIVEASADGLPLIIITADRPPELQACGANQTIDQTRLYGDFVRATFDLPCPDEDLDPRMLLTTIDQAIHRAKTGPVHLNFKFREPLAPSDDGRDLSAVTKQLRRWIQTASPFTRYAAAVTEPDEKDTAPIADILNNTETGLVIVGRLLDRDERLAVADLIEHLGWPVLADITSGLSTLESPPIIPHYDLCLFSDSFAARHRPQTILHLGGQFVSKRLLRLVHDSNEMNYIVVNNRPDRYDPAHRVTHRLQYGVRQFCRQIAPSLHGNTDPACLRAWQKASDTIGGIIETVCAESMSPFEPAIVRLLLANLAADSALFVAGSMPVRDLDIFAPAGAGPLDVGSNRGVSGIDGTIASAAGYAAGLNRPVTLLSGDLACLHDLNSLALLNKINSPVTVVILNNNGGGIFGHLPIARHQDVFERYFVTPHGFVFDQAAAMFDLPFVRTDDTRTFVSAYQTARQSERSSIIEVSVDREQNQKFHDRLIDEIVTALRD